MNGAAHSTFILFFATGIVAATPPAITTAALEAMSPDDRYALVLGALQWRDEQLQNFSYDLVETRERVSLTDGSRTAPQKRVMTVKRNESNVVLVCQRYSAAGELQSDFVISWDGSRELSLTTRSQSSRGSGRISDFELPIVREVAYNQMLGLRMLSEPSETLVEFLKRNASDGAEIHIRAAGEAEPSLITVAVISRPVERVFWLDVARDFMPVRYSYSDGGNTESHRVADAKEIDGLWVPLKVIRRTGTKASDGQGVWVYETTRFTRGGVTDGDFDVVFPPGTHVVDNIRNIAFRVDERGREVLLPLYNPDTGLVTKGGETVDQVFAQAAAPFEPSSGWRQWGVIALAGVLLLSGVVLLMYKRTRRASARR